MTEQEKARFRQRKAWTTFRKKLKKERRSDPITGQPLSKKYNLHHCDFHPEHYTNLDPNNFECLNNMSHDVVHFFFGVPGRLKNWRALVLRLIRILKKMEQLNKEQPNEEKAKDPKLGNGKRRNNPAPEAGKD